MNQKYSFLYALIISLVVFNVGIFFGYMLEASRTEDISKLYLDAELELLDQTAQKDAVNLLNVDCNSLIQSNIEFGDRVYNEALLMEKYESASKISDDIIFQHKRFDLLRTLFWMNSIKIKQQCNSSYHNVVYLYRYNNPSLEQKSKQNFFSNTLAQIKADMGDKVMLIPIAADNNISSVNLLIKKYNISEFPVIFIDEEIKITEINNIEDVEKYLI